MIILQMCLGSCDWERTVTSRTMVPAVTVVKGVSLGAYTLSGLRLRLSDQIG